MALDRAYAEKLDAADPLAGYRERFLLTDPALIYLNGNSLGALPLAVLQRMGTVYREEWGTALARSWDHWVDLPARAGDVVAELIGAAPGQVIVTDNTTVNLYKLATAALDARPGRHVIVTDHDNFPSDRYVMAGLAAQRGAELRMLATDIDEGVHPDLVRAAVDEDTALVSLSHVAYRSGALADMAAITRIAQAAGALMLWDLCHSVGAVPVDLDGNDVDLAVGCTYKYLNAGPGAPAFAYVSARLREVLRQPIWGWFSQRDQFAMGPRYDPAAGYGQVHDRHAVDPRHGGGGGGRAAAARGGHRADAGQEHAADRLPDRAGRRLAGPARLHDRHAAGGQPARRPRQLRPSGRRADRGAAR